MYLPGTSLDLFCGAFHDIITETIEKAQLVVFAVAGDDRLGDLYYVSSILPELTDPKR